jgi:hypothetical protein
LNDLDGCNERRQYDGSRRWNEFRQYASEGPAKRKTTTPPRTFARSQTHPHISFSTFWGVSRWGEFKNTTKTFLQKVHVKNFPQKRKHFRCQFSSFFWGLSRFRVCRSLLGVQKHLKKHSFSYLIVPKSFYKKSTTNPKPIFGGFIAFSGVSQFAGSSKAPKKTLIFLFNCTEKFLQKIDNKSETNFLSICFHRVF